MADGMTPEQVLRWYITAGVDAVVQETPVDRYAAPARAAEQPSRRQAQQQQPQAAPAREAAAQPAEQPGVAPTAAQARQQAPHVQDIHTIAELRQALDAFDACPLKATASTTVVGDGDPTTPLMLVGEAPGADEDRQGLPFVGRAGGLLDRMLAAIGRDRSSCYISNILPWRPPGNRQPTTQEVAMLLPFAERHIELVDPAVLVFLGGTSAKALLARKEGIMKLRGRWHNYATPGLPRPVPAMATFHPAYLLRNPGQKRLAWRDLLAVEARLADTTTD